STVATATIRTAAPPRKPHFRGSRRGRMPYRSPSCSCMTAPRASAKDAGISPPACGSIRRTSGWRCPPAGGLVERVVDSRHLLDAADEIGRHLGPAWRIGSVVLTTELGKLTEAPNRLCHLAVQRVEVLGDPDELDLGERR